MTILKGPVRKTPPLYLRPGNDVPGLPPGTIRAYVLGPPTQEYAPVPQGSPHSRFSFRTQAAHIIRSRLARRGWGKVALRADWHSP